MKTGLLTLGTLFCLTAISLLLALSSVTPLWGQWIPSSVPSVPYALPPVSQGPDGLLRSFAHCYPQVPWARAPEIRLGLSAFSLLHFVLSLISLSCTSGPHMTPHPSPSLPPSPSLLIPSVPRASPASLPQCSPRAALGQPRLLPVLGAAGSAQAQSDLGRSSAASWRSLCPVPCALCFGGR